MLQHIAFYRFATLRDVDAVIARLQVLAEGLTGSVLVAEEGINGMLAGEGDVLDGFESALRSDDSFEGAFADIVFKRTDCRTPPFARLKIRRKREIVPLGEQDVDVSHSRDADVPPAQWRELIQREDVVLLDNRNSFEAKLGRFKGAIDPGVRNFRDFPAYVRAHLDEWKREGKTVAMYCTGGIRCEKTSAWMRGMGVPVAQLEGGILNYFQQMPDAEKDFEGECFVFDNRIALDTHSQETGTTLEDVYAAESDGEWRLQRAKRLAASS